MDAVIAGFSDSSRRAKELANELTRRTSAKVSIDEETLRVVIHTDKLDVVSKTPGVDRAALAYKADKEPKSIAKKVVKLLRDIEEKYDTMITKYSLQVYPIDDRMFDSIAREVYALASYKTSPNSPYGVFVDIVSSGAYVYSERIDGPGGLPIGVAGPAIALISGGIDSFVASYMAMRRGFKVIGFYPILTLRGKSLLERVNRLASSIDDTFLIKPFDLMEEYQELMEEVQGLELEDYSAIALKLRIIKRMAEEVKALGVKNIIIGDVLMQSPTQTPKLIRAENIIAEKMGVHLFRPILSSNNRELIRRAEFLELENARDPIELNAPWKVDDDTLKIIIELVLGL